MRWLVSQRFQADYRFDFENEVKVYEFVLRNGYWLSTTGLLFVYRVVGRQGVDFKRSHQWLLHWSCMYNACYWF